MVLRRRALPGLVLLLAVWLGATGAAVAHGGGATFEVLEAVESPPGQVSLRVGVAHEADGHPAEGAIVEVVPVAPDGSVSPSSTVERQGEPGTHAARLDLQDPGTWTLVVTSSFPPGMLEVPVTVGATDGPADGDGAMVAAADPDQADPDEADPDEDESGRTTSNLVIAAVSGVVGGSLGLWASKRRSARKRAAADDGSTPA